MHCSIRDCNDHIGSHDTDNTFTFHQSTNTNEKLAIDYADEVDTITTKSTFKKGRVSCGPFSQILEV